MTFRTLIGTTILVLRCMLARWREQTFHRSRQKVTSPNPNDFAPDTFCKVKGFESRLCKIVAVGYEAEMKINIEELENESGTSKTPPPPSPKLHTK